MKLPLVIRCWPLSMERNVCSQKSQQVQLFEEALPSWHCRRLQPPVCVPQALCRWTHVDQRSPRLYLDIPSTTMSISDTQVA